MERLLYIRGRKEGLVLGGPAVQEEGAGGGREVGDGDQAIGGGGEGGRGGGGGRWQGRRGQGGGGRVRHAKEDPVLCGRGRDKRDGRVGEGEVQGPVGAKGVDQVVTHGDQAAAQERKQRRILTKNAGGKDHREG